MSVYFSESFLTLGIAVRIEAQAARCSFPFQTTCSSFVTDWTSVRRSYVIHLQTPVSQAAETYCCTSLIISINMTQLCALAT